MAGARKPFWASKNVAISRRFAWRVALSLGRAGVVVWGLFCFSCLGAQAESLLHSSNNANLNPGVVQPLKKEWEAPEPKTLPLTPEEADTSQKIKTTIDEDVIGPRPDAPPAAPDSKRDARLDAKPNALNENDAREPSPKFVLREILITGVTVFQGKQLEEKFSDAIDREVDLQDLLKIAGDITKLYKESGYITSRAVIPPQDIENGSVTIQVQEGRLENVQVEGNRYVRKGYLRSRMSQKPGEVFRLQALQKDMLSLSLDPLLNQAHATLKAGVRPNTSTLLLDVSDHRPLHVLVGADNLGRQGIGMWRTNATVLHENLLGFGDSGYISGILATKTTTALGQYKFPLNRTGWMLGGSYGFTRVDGGETPSPVFVAQESKIRSITGKSHQVSLFTEFPIYRSLVSRRWNVSGQMALSALNSMTYLDGISLRAVQQNIKAIEPSFQEEKLPTLRTLSSMVRLSEQDRTGRWLLNGGVTHGMTALGGNESYLKFNADLSRIQKLPWGMIGVFRGQSQWTSDRLPFAEKMQLGGSESVRGYSEGFLIADAGYFLGGEIRYPLKFLPTKLRDAWQGLLFVEHGRVFACGDSDAPSTVGRPGSLLGYGVGVRGRVSKYLTARLDLGFSTTRAESQPDLRAHFSINSELF